MRRRVYHRRIEPPRAPRIPLAALAVVLLVGVFVLHVAYTSGAVLDDAYISFRYARNLASGRGLVFNPGERVEGYTNFTWVVLAAGVLRTGLDPAWIMPLVGVACGIAVIAVTARGARALARDELRDHPLAGVPASAVVALSPSLAFYAGTGLETALFTLLCAVGGLAVARRRPVVFAIATGVAFLTRPEAALLGLAGLVVMGLGPDGRRDVTRAATALAAIVLPYLAFKLLYFGALLPNTLAAKPPRVADGATYVLWALPEVAGLLLVGALGARSRGRTTLLALWAVFTVAVALEGGDWMPCQRLLVPSLPWLAIAVDRPLLALFTLPRSRRDAWRAALLVAALAYAPLALLDSAPLHREAATIAAYDPVRVRIARTLSDAGVRSVGTVDIGLLGYRDPDLRILDLGGLTDRAIGGSPGPHLDKDVPIASLDARAPDAFLLLSRVPPVANPSGGVMAAGFYGTERRVMGTPWFRERYRFRTAFEIRPDYYMLWFERAS